MPKTGKSKQPAQAGTRRDCYYQQLLHQARCQRNIAVRPEELAWFDIRHYDYVRDLSLKHLMTELIVRGALCSKPDIVTWNGAVLRPGEIFQTCYPRITAGKPAVHPLFISHEQLPELKYLPAPDTPASPVLTSPVRELSISDIDDCYHALSATDVDKAFFHLKNPGIPVISGI